MAEKLTGGCQCGDVRYEVAGTPGPLIVCHCVDCQQQSGSAFGMTLVVEEDDFAIVEGAVATFTAESEAGRQKLGAFCPGCGSRLYHKLEYRPGKLSVKPGTLDDTSRLAPTVHIWTRSKQPWVTIPADAEQHEKNAPG